MSSAIFRYRQPSAQARARVVCLPHAGGSAALYREWPALLGSTFEVCAAELPARGRRFAEAPWTDAVHAAREIAAALAELPPLPVVLFGHSLGARLAFALVARAGVEARAIVVAAAPGPHLTPRRGMADLGHDELIRELRALGGTPPEVLDNAEMMELLLPMLRGDLRMAEWGAAENEAIGCPITVLWGARDRDVSRADAESWSAHSKAGVTFVAIDGGHFFVGEQVRDVLPHVRAAAGIP